MLAFAVAVIAVGGDTWGGQTLKTSSGKRFELHFYRSLADDINTTIDFKMVFMDSIP